MPFTHDQFLDVFARYNTLLWPAAVVLWLASAITFLWLLRSARPPSRALAALLAFHWAWAGVVYHAAFFTAINPAAWLFAALFVVGTAGFVAYGIVGRRLRFSMHSDPRHWIAGIFIVYSLMYPALTLLSGQVFPRAATFGVPCPTTLFTIGLLLAADDPFPRLLAVVPVLWALIGGSAASLLHVPPDWALFVAAFALVVRVVRRPETKPQRADV